MQHDSILAEFNATISGMIFARLTSTRDFCACQQSTINKSLLRDCEQDSGSKIKHATVVQHLL